MDMYICGQDSHGNWIFRERISQGVITDYASHRFVDMVKQWRFSFPDVVRIVFDVAVTPTVEG